jgi:hypothetical protein
MAEFQWWLLIVGLVAGGGLVAVVSMDGRRRDEDIGEVERQAEATWISSRLSGRDRELAPGMVESVLRAHREYLALPPPDRLVIEGTDLEARGPGVGSSPDPDVDLEVEMDDLDLDRLDLDPDRMPDDVGDGRSGGADEDLPSARVQEAPASQQAHPRADREERAD